MKIVQAPQKVLSEKAKTVAKIDKTILQLLKEMEQTLTNAKDPEGVGLAAPQVGKALRIFIARPRPQSPLLVCINPTIEKYLDEEEQEIKQNEKTSKAKKKAKIDKGVQLEGCLSLKDVWGVVKRYSGVILSYQDETGKQHKKTFTGFTATIVQHECDHLEGYLFTKRVLEQKNPLYHSIKNEQNETEFEEIKL
jgi:peptide deformylase